MKKLFLVAMLPCLGACSPAQWQTAKTVTRHVLNVAQTACVLASPLIQTKDVLQACNIADDLFETVDVLLDGRAQARRDGSCHE